MCNIILIIVIIVLSGILIYMLLRYESEKEIIENRHRDEMTEMGSRAIAAAKIFRRQDAIEYYILGSPHLNCGHNGLIVDSLTLSHYPKLTVLWCHDNELEKLDVSRNTSLYGLLCHDNRLTSLDVEKNKKLKNLCCRNNHLTELYLNSRLEYLDCSNNMIEFLNLSSSLESLNCSNNKLELLDVSQCLELYELYCSANPLKTLIISDSQQNALWLGDIRKEYPDIQIYVSDTKPSNNNGK